MSKSRVGKLTIRIDSGNEKVEKENMAETINDKVRLAMSLLPMTGHAGEPSVHDYLSLDWKMPFHQLPVEAQELVEKMVAECHVSTLQIILKLAEQRILRDFQLWMMLKDVRDMIRLGDGMYVKKRR